MISAKQPTTIVVKPMTATDSNASTPRSTSSVALSDLSRTLDEYGKLQIVRRHDEETTHPILVARDSFLTYLADNVRTSVTPREQYIASLIDPASTASAGQRFIAKQMRQKLNNVRMSLERNSAIAYDICRQVQYLLSPDLVPPSKPTSSADEGITRSTIRQLWRDWSIEAREERNICYDPILTSIRAQVCQLDTQERASFRILVPGAGLCRLAYEITKISHGPVIANELSYHQILATHWVLNQSSAQPFEVCPWATQFSNHVKSSDQFRSYSIPELGSITHNFESEAILEPYDVHGNDHVALRCGDLFVTPDDFRDYASPEHKDTFNCVVTAFFLDTAPNVLDYITTIQNILVSGGTWLNVGPLLWNCFENGPGGRREGDGDDDEAAQLRQISDRRISGIAAETKTFDGKVEMAWDEILELIKLVGFTIEENVENLGNAGYILDCQSMLLPMYQVGYFRVTKKA